MLDGPWTAIGTGSDGEWSLAWGQGGVNPVAVPDQLVSGLSMSLDDGGAFGILPGVNNYGTGWDFSFRPRNRRGPGNGHCSGHREPGVHGHDLRPGR